MGLREELLEIDDRPSKVIPVPFAAGGVRQIRIRSLDGPSRDRITSLYMAVNGLSQVPPCLHETLVVLGVIDDAGAQIFTEKDVQTIGAKWGAAIKVVSDAVLEISGLRDGAVEEAAKNSPGDLSESSGSGSPLPSDNPQ